MVEPSDNLPKEEVLAVSYPKAFIVMIVPSGLFFTILYFMIRPIDDPLLTATFVFMVIFTLLTFPLALVVMGRAKIGVEGVRSMTPTFYGRIIRWDDMVGISKLRGFPYFYTANSRDLMKFCIIPRRYLLRHPDRLKELILKYSPADHVLRRQLADS